MRFARSIHRQIADFGAENMGKDINPGVKSVKQWGGAQVLTISSMNIHFGVSPTGGVPTKTPGKIILFALTRRYCK